MFLATKNAKDAKMNRETLNGFVRTVAVVAAVMACMASVGCRRTDVRDFEVSIPSLTAENESAIRQSLSGFGGVEKSSLKFDRQAKKLTLRYDSMQLAKKNIEMAIAKAGYAANGVTPESVGKNSAGK